MLLQETEQVGELCNRVPGGHVLDSSAWMMATSGVVHLRTRGKVYQTPLRNPPVPPSVYIGSGVPTKTG